MAKRERNIFNVPVEPDTSKLIDADSQKMGMSKAEFFRRLLTWYATQNDVMRGSIMGTIPDSVAVDVAKLALQRMANGDAPANYIGAGLGGPKRKG